MDRETSQVERRAGTWNGSVSTWSLTVWDYVIKMSCPWKSIDFLDSINLHLPSSSVKSRPILRCASKGCLQWTDMHLIILSISLLEESNSNLCNLGLIHSPYEAHGSSAILCNVHLLYFHTCLFDAKTVLFHYACIIRRKNAFFP